MNLSEVIFGFKSLDEDAKISTREFQNYLIKNLLVVMGIMALGIVVALLFGDITGWVLGGIIIIVWTYSYISGKERTRACEAFAQKYNLNWLKKSRGHYLANEGVIFGVGHSPYLLDGFDSTVGTVKFGAFTYKFTTGSGKHKRDHYYTVGYYDIPKELPHILLDSKKNDGLLNSSIPRMLNKDYKVSLEGDFDQHFTLYTAFPKPAEALTIISPEVMQTLIDETPEVDIEISNRRIWIYLPGLKRYKGYGEVLQAGLHVLNSASNNMLHYRLEDTGQLIAQELQRKKLGSPSKLVLILFALVVLAGIALNLLVGYSG